MRTLTTIGGLRSMRAMERDARLAPLRGMGWLGATNPDFAPPAGLDSGSMGVGLSNALNTLLQTYSANGVPPESTADALAGAFQRAWNADPMVAAVGGNALLDVDGGYGTNSASAVSAINGGSYPPVNGGTAPAPIPGTTPVLPAPAPIVPALPSGPAAAPSSHAGLLWLVAIAAAIAAAYAAHRMMRKKKGARGRRRAALPSRAIVLT